MNPEPKLTVKDWQTLALPVLIERLREIMEEIPAAPAPPSTPSASTIRATFRG